MRGYSIMSDQERQDILKKHQELYNGYAVGNVPTNMTPLTVYDPAGDKEGITVTSKGDVKQYTNHNINEIAAKNLHYDEIDPAYEFDSDGPALGMAVQNPGKKSYQFVSKGPMDVYEEDEEGFVELDSIDTEEDIETVKESINKSLDMFKRFKKFN
jgi:hypothetical protein